MLLVFLLGGAAGSALVVALDEGSAAWGANSSALALLAAWTMRDVLARRRGEEDDADMLGVLAFAVVLVLIPIAGGRGEPAGRPRRRRHGHPARARARPRAPALDCTEIVPGSPAARRPTTQPSIAAPVRHGGEQPAGGHRVAQQPPPRLGHRLGPGGEALGVGAVALRAARERLLALEQREHAVDRRDGGGVDLRRDAARRRQLVHVAEQAEARDVGERVRARRRAPARRRGR